MAQKFLDVEGVKTLWSKVKAADTTALTTAKSYTDTRIQDLETRLDNGNVQIPYAEKTTYDYEGNKIHETYIKLSQKAVVNGVATLDANGKVPSSQLPSYVDDVLEYSNASSFPTTGETGKIYVALDTNKIYRFSGTQYTVISETLSLGETASTAYSGASGKANATAIAALQGKFTGDAVNKALKVCSKTNYDIYVDYDELHNAILLAKNAVVARVDGANDNEYIAINTALNNFTVQIKDTNANMTGYFEVSDVDSYLSAGSNLYLGYTKVNNKATQWAEDIYMYASDSVNIKVSSTPILIDSSTFKVGSDTNKVNFNVIGGVYSNGHAVLTDQDVVALTDSELNSILV